MSSTTYPSVHQGSIRIITRTPDPSGNRADHDVVATLRGLADCLSFMNKFSECVAMVRTYELENNQRILAEAEKELDRKKAEIDALQDEIARMKRVKP